MISESPDLHRLVRSPVFGAEEQGKALAAVLDKSGIGGLAGNFLKLITANRRLFAVRDMVRELKVRAAKIMEELDSSASRRVRGLGAKQREQLNAKFAK